MTEENNKILDRHIGQRIKERRKFLGLTQAELGGILGISFQQIQRYESGENTVTLPRILEIANILNVKPNFFYDNAPTAASESKKLSSDVIQKLSNRFIRVLLIEDNESDDLLFRKAVQWSELPVEVLTISDSEKVMDFLYRSNTKDSAESPDLIVLDINMPGLNGLELLRLIKGDPQTQTIPVIMLTNSIRNKDMIEAYRNHANGFVQKSSDLSEFYEDVDRMLEFWTKTAILPLAS